MPFPFVERPRLRPRPALLVSTDPIAADEPLAWVLMITSAENAGWPDDISLIERHEECGLPVPCVIRPAKIATVAMSLAQPLGRLPEDIMEAVRAKIARFLAF